MRRERRLKKALIRCKASDSDVTGGYESGTFSSPIFSVVAKERGDGAKRRVFGSGQKRHPSESWQTRELIRRRLLAGIKSVMSSVTGKRITVSCAQGPDLRPVESMDSWLYDEKDPMMHLEYRNTGFRIRLKRNDEGQDYFEKLIQDVSA